MEYRLQSMYNHMVERAASVISPFYFILLGLGFQVTLHRKRFINDSQQCPFNTDGSRTFVLQRTMYTGKRLRFSQFYIKNGCTFIIYRVHFYNIQGLLLILMVKYYKRQRGVYMSIFDLPLKSAYILRGENIFKFF